MSFLKSLSTFLATKYGKVTGGKYAGASLGLGNDSQKVVEVNPVFTQLLFIEGTKEIARVPVSEVASYEIVLENIAGMALKLNWKSGGESMIKIDKLDRQGKKLAYDPVGKVLGALSNK